MKQGVPAGLSFKLKSGRSLMGLPIPLFTRHWRRLVKPTSQDERGRRQELILYVLLWCGAALAIIGALVAAITWMSLGKAYTGVSPLLPLTFTLIMIVLRYISSLGQYRVAAYAYISLFFIAGTYSLARWSIDLPDGVLVYSVVVVMAGILLGTVQALWVTAFIITTLIGLGVMQANGIIHPDTSWTTAGLNPLDGVTFGVTLGIIAAVSWLSNREIDRSLRLARESEKALKHERSNLEVLVKRRTAELEQAQLERVLELERFAEFGRLSSGLLHDIANPITAVSLNLEQLKGERSDLVAEAQKSLRYLEGYIEAARRQLQSEEPATEFDVGEELQKVCTMLQHKARNDKVGIILRTTHAGKLFGDASKFCRVMANLIANAVESYETNPDIRSDRQVTVEANASDGVATITIRDWGVGISAANLGKVFEPFYTTRTAQGRGTGIGLAVTKRLVEQDLHGAISVTSIPNKGTVFTITLPNNLD